MKFIHNVACLAISFIFCIVVPALSQWIPKSNGLEGGPIADLFSDGESVFAATSASLYVSSNDGESWTAVSIAIGDLQPRCLTGSGSTLFLGSQFGGVFRSIDGGGSWTKAGSEITSTVRAVHLRNNKVFAGTSSGVYVSSNNGTNWTLSNSGLSENNAVWSFASDQNAVYLTTGDGVYESRNEGASWSRVGASIFGTSRVILIDDALYVSAGTIFKSTRTENSWSDWSDASNGLPVDVQAARLFSYNNEILAATTKGVYRADNDASAWTMSSDGLPLETSVTSFVVHGGKVLAGTNSGIYVSSNANNWSAINTGLRNPQVSCFVSSNGVIYAGTNAGVFRSNDEGDSWQPARLGLTGTGLYVITLLSDGTKLYAGTQKGMYVSSDNGDHWDFANTGIPINYIPTKLVKHNDKILVGLLSFGPDPQGTRIYTTNDGALWTPLASDLPGSWMVGALASSNGVLYAGVDASVYKSTNNGSSWTLSKMGSAGGSYVTTLLANGDKVYYELARQLFRSIDNGVSWESLTPGSISGQTFSLEIEGANVLLGATLSDSPVMWSNDSGNTFKPGSAGLVSRSNSALFIVNDKLFGGFAGGQSVWVRSLNDFSSKLISFSPTSGPPSTTVTINGNNFDVTPSGNTVTFNDVAATVLSASPSQLTVTVPAMATTGKIAVAALGQTTTSEMTFTVEEVITGVETIREQEALSVFPNPADNVVNIKIDSSMPASLAICDLLGHVVQNSNVTAGHSAVDVTGLRPGYYIIKATAGTVVYHCRFMKR